MNFMQSLKMAMKSIKGNKMRTFLTMLGIIIGVCAVIILVSIVQGSTKSLTERMSSMGTNMVQVMITGRNTSKTIDMKDMEELIADNPTLLSAVAPNMSGRVTAKYENKNSSINVIGTNSSFSEIRNVTVQSGRFINEQDVTGRKNYALIGTYNVSDLFSGQDPLNKQIKLNGEIYTVIGVLEEKSNGRQGSDDDRIIIPYTSAKKLLNTGTINSYYLQAKDTDTIAKAVSAAEAYLLKKLGNSNAYNIFNMQDMLDSVNEMTGMMSLLAGGIAAISLLVGGIGIMNIMLVSVTERTKEIGIRKAIGAKRGSILTQFLIESAVVSSMGGIVGILIGIVGALGVGSAMNIDATPSFGVMFFSFAFAASVGIFFGLYPANKASKLNPIDALRFE